MSVIIKKITRPVRATLVCLLAFVPSAYVFATTANISGVEIANTFLIDGLQSTATFDLSLSNVIPSSALKIDVSFTNVDIIESGITGTIKNSFRTEVSDKVVIFTQKNNLISNTQNFTVSIPIVSNTVTTESINGFNVNISGAQLNSEASVFTRTNPLGIGAVWGQFNWNEGKTWQ